MIALAIVLSALILIALLRFGVIIEYSSEGLKMWAKVGFLKIYLSDEKDKKKPKKKKPKKAKKDTNFKDMLPGSLSGFLDILKTLGRSVRNTLSRFKRRLLIKQLTLYYTSAGEDPANTAMIYGAANAVFGTTIPVLERNFRIKRYDLRAFADFTAKEQGIYAKIAVSIAVWEVFYIVFALFPIIPALFRNRPARKKERIKPEESAVSS